ncbi:hypothetical protein [Clostridium beijerinckii]|uniref:hypothetical protein n=1 Tax=Clostridium beijerinckii TaxID=1520 RepID=UPI0022E7449B|nr:hypothetical protein [Clostridium beijerinckii]
MEFLRRIMFGAMIFAIIIYIGGCSMTNQKSKQVEQGMMEYLTKKYGIEFEFVKKPYLTGNEGFGYRYQAKVIPAGKPELEFFVEQEDRVHVDNFVDGYLKVKWTYEGKQEIEKKIKEVYGSETDFDLEYTFRYNKEEFKDLSYAEVLAKCNRSVYIDISYYIFSDEKLDKDKEAEKAYKIMKQYLLDNKFNKYDFNVLFFKHKYKEEYVSNGNAYGKKSLDTLHEEGALINFLKAYNLEELHPIEVNTSSDLVKWFKY